MAEPERIARQVYYSGRVQGVGFRYTAASIARSHAVAGWVRNLDDDRVQLVIEGPAGSVQACLHAIRDYWGTHIRDEEMEELEPAGLPGFEIRIY
jgi:acylphosphatase